jgi:hypothetical protein
MLAGGRLKQVKIDNGQIGGIITIIINSMFVFNFVTFVNTCAIAYDLFLHEYVSLQVGVVLLLAGAGGWFFLYYAIIYPSIIRFANKQAYLHDSPIKEDLDIIKKKLEEMEG